MIEPKSGKDKPMPLGPKEEALRAQRLAAIADGKPAEDAQRNLDAWKRKRDAKATNAPKAPMKAKGASKPKKATKARKAKAKRTSEPRTGSKTGIIRELLTRPEGCTTADILAATGWKAVSLPDQARRLDVKLKTEKDGRIIRYHVA